MNNIIKIQKLKKDYSIDKNRVNVLKSVDLTISQGEMVAIMGTSGSGKSTLLNILACIDKADSGVYLLDNIDIIKCRSKELAKVRSTKIGIVFQDFNLISDYTVFDNIKLALSYKAHHSKEKVNFKETIFKYLKMVGLEDKYNKYPSQLSGGEQQRVAIARTLATDPLVILADEPTGALDKKNTIEILNLFKKINSTGKTIVLVTHDEAVASHCHRTLIMEDGNLEGI